MKVLRSGSAMGGPYRGGAMRVILDKMDIKQAIEYWLDREFQANPDIRIPPMDQYYFNGENFMDIEMEVRVNLG